MRLLGALALAVPLMGRAPLQCSSEPEPSQRPYETPAQALYGLAQRFREAGDDAAWRATLEHLVARYPNDRFARQAREDLARAPEDPPR